MNIKCKNCQESFEPLNDEDLCHWCLIEMVKTVNLITAEKHIPQFHTCEKCGAPGAELHFPGGFLCPGGCEKKEKFNFRNWKDDQYER